MAFTPTSFLSSNPATTLRDQQHAARLFTDDQFRLAPKHKFLFHVAFSINTAACKDINLVQRHKNEIGMLVKAIDLPGYDMSVETLNQYNRKKRVQTGHKTKDITATFHDDNMGVINQLWQNYYSYYYADSISARNKGAYNRNATKNSSSIVTPYGLDNGSNIPFFNYITIYQMARHEYVSYKLINPVIMSWTHNKVDYSQGGSHDNSMGLSYEAIEYGNGIVTSDAVEGFGTEHYDQTPSPLTGAGSQTVSPSFGDPNNPRISPWEVLNNTSTSINTYQNTQPLPSPGTAGISNIIQSAQQGVSGLQGIAFPLSKASSAITGAIEALPLNLGF
jgi:hypothetical protein